MDNKLFAFAVLPLLSLTAACSGDPTSSGGEGSIAFTTWGEDYIQVEIPQDSGAETGFVDGWKLEYSKFLVVIKNITVADSQGSTGAKFSSAKIFNHKVDGVKSIVDFDGLETKNWDEISYEIGPIDGDVERDDSAESDDLDYMRDNGYSLRLVADVTKGDVVKHIDWGFDLATRYETCHSEQNGKDEKGVVVTNGRTADVQLTIHGDHPFYDRLQDSNDPAVKTSLRFDAVAEADANHDGVVELDELDANAGTLDVFRYNPSGEPVTTLGGFVRALARTVGHFRGEGECTVKNL